MTEEPRMTNHREAASLNSCTLLRWVHISPVLTQLSNKGMKTRGPAKRLPIPTLHESPRTVHGFPQERLTIMLVKEAMWVDRITGEHSK